MNDVDSYRLDTVLSALGAIRQDIRALLAAVARLEGNVPLTAPEVDCRVPGCNCHVKDEA